MRAQGKRGNGSQYPKGLGIGYAETRRTELDLDGTSLAHGDDGRRLAPFEAGWCAGVSEDDYDFDRGRLLGHAGTGIGFGYRDVAELANGVDPTLFEDHYHRAMAQAAGYNSETGENRLTDDGDASAQDAGPLWSTWTHVRKPDAVVWKRQMKVTERRPEEPIWEGPWSEWLKRPASAKRGISTLIIGDSLAD